jgi:hypothetical protein
MEPRRTVLAGLLVLAAAAPAAAQEPSLATVLQRAGAYVAEFERQLSGIVAEEHYVQDVHQFAKRRGCPGNATYASVLNCQGQLVMPMRSELRSDLLLVRPAGASRWAEFRDVFEADGRPIRDRGDRLTRLFLGETPSAPAQLGRILDESARFNIGDIERNINTPLFALQILEPANQRRFRFKRAGNRMPGTFSRENTPTGAFRVATEIWIVEYEERERGTLIKTAGLKDLPTRGRFWIDPESGRVMMSELVAADRTVKGTIDVSYQSEPLLGLLVPIEMREHHRNNKGSEIDGAATYGRFRQFQVNVDETFMPAVKR